MILKMKNILCLVLFLNVLQVFGQSQQGSTKPKTGGVDPDTYANVDSKGVILQGYDPVAFFTVKKPVKGQPKFQSRYKGAIYWFSSEANKKMFDGNPEKYKVHFGGWCAYAVSRGYTASTDIDTWSIQDGKLILQYSERVARTWKDAPDENLAKALKNWPEVAKKKLD